MRKYSIAIIILSAALIFGCGGDDKKSSSAKSTASAKPKAKKIDGEKIFKMNCVICHGADGKLGINGAKDLTISEFTLEQRIENITKGKGAMTPFESILTKEQIQAVAEYTFKL